MHLLYMWRRYYEDVRSGFTHRRLYQNSLAMKEIGIGESLWAFTRHDDGHYVLVARLVTAATGEDVANEDGRYWVRGDSFSKFYVIDDGNNDFEAIVRSLGISTSAEILGSSFQGSAGVRRLDAAAHEKLIAFSERLL